MRLSSEGGEKLGARLPKRGDDPLVTDFVDDLDS